MALNFVRDDKLGFVAEQYALDALDHARDKFGIVLDFSDASIAQVEQILNDLHLRRAQENPPSDTIRLFCKMFGSYIGEVYRRNHGAVWGIAEGDPGRMPILATTPRQRRGVLDLVLGRAKPLYGSLIWPWIRVNNRLSNGAEDNVYHYYKYIMEEE